jgi:hypothetical protein
MKNAPPRLLFVMFALMVLFSCSKDDGVTPCSAAWASDLQNEITAIGTAANIYSMDQSEANCNALKAAYQDYIDALKPYGNCTTLSGVSRTEWQNAINEAEESLDSIC